MCCRQIVMKLIPLQLALFLVSGTSRIRYANSIYLSEICTSIIVTWYDLVLQKEPQTCSYAMLQLCCGQVQLLLCILYFSKNCQHDTVTGTSQLYNASSLRVRICNCILHTSYYVCIASAPIVSYYCTSNQVAPVTKTMICVKCPSFMGLKPHKQVQEQGLGIIVTQVTTVY